MSAKADCQCNAKLAKNVVPYKSDAYFIELFAYAVNQPLNLGDLELATIRSDKTLLIFYGTLVVVGAWHWGSTNPI
ncbi:hypothetical protein [uncultured Duncaniella sp.]|uniref:hypothetical protein n=1 Tax=uncultured Duncaniella sp. TaxID=2768039 RepID=UPI0032203DB0